MDQDKSKKHLIWLASYPKSGNTWFRILLANIISENQSIVNINKISDSRFASSRTLIDSVIGFDSSILTNDEMEDLKPRVFNYLSLQSTSPIYFKTHEAYTYNREGKALFPLESTFKAVYIIRNPLDMVASIGNHYSISYDRAIDFMNHDNLIILNNSDRYFQHTAQKILSWRKNVESWTNTKDLDVHIIKYEDLHCQTLSTVTKALDYLNIEYTRTIIEEAIDNSDFRRLKKQEMDYGFNEKPGNCITFFRKGKVNGYKDELTSSQIEKVLSENESVMKVFGYI